ncbi:hypoxanthine-guanine phosphoribosyltransferase [Nitrosomonadales bacterium]|nr:hypoxanthine-guanine phosphoribosyltransferase [Nitrosomonadales bacterium]
MNLNKLISNSSLIYSNEEINEAIENLAKTCNSKFIDQKVTVLPVMKGALVFAGQLISKFNFFCELDYVHASRYLNNEAKSKVDWKYQPNIDLIKDKVILVLDDILDEGITLNNIKKKLIEMGAKEVLIVVLFDKKLDKQKPIKVDFIGLEVPDSYVYGFGLDFKGIGRNIPHLYSYN